MADWQNHRGYNVNLLNEDVEKLNILTQIVDQNTYYILKNYNLETNIGRDDYIGLENLVVHFQNDPFPFHNNNIQKKYEDFEKKSRKFLGELGTLYFADGEGRATWRSAAGSWVDDETYQRVMSKIGGLNRMATELAEAWEDFIKLSKTELRGNSIGIASYTPRK